MKIVLPGGSGLIGGVLARDLVREGHEVVVLSRRPGPAPTPWRTVARDGRTAGEWAREIDGADAVVNLAGRSVHCRYGQANRRAILASRVESTRAVGEAIARAARPPAAWLQASTATLYAHRFDAPNDERTGILGGGEPGVPETWRFSVEVARAWERALEEAPAPRTRKVAMRMAIVMDPAPGGPFDILRRLARAGPGGRSGNGRQYVSWIHGGDLARAVRFILAHRELCGPVNIASPHPLPNAEFMAALRAACGRRLGLPASAWMLEVGAFLLRTETELVLKSRRVVPGKLLESGFALEHPRWPEAARALCEAARRPPARRSPPAATP